MTDLPTPLEEAPPSLSGGRPLFLKREDVHELGAFKWRGALPALESFRARGADGVVTASTGNHGAATAWAAERLGMRAVVFVPEEASEAKLGLLEQLGAELHRVGADLDESKELAREHAAANDLPFFEDGAEPAQFDGYEAIGREISEQLGRPPARVIVPVGNGALIIGVARGVGPVLGVVAKEAPVMALSVEAGHPVESRSLRDLRRRHGGARCHSARRRGDEPRRNADDDGVGARDRPRGRRLRGSGHPGGGLRAPQRSPRSVSWSPRTTRRSSSSPAATSTTTSTGARSRSRRASRTRTSSRRSRGRTCGRAVPPRPSGSAARGPLTPGSRNSS